MAAASYPLFIGPNGRDAYSDILLLAELAKPTIGDALHAGRYLEGRIRERTAIGVDANGSAFVPYSPAYAKQKAKKLRHANVDLFGYSRRHMVMSITVQAGSVALANGAVATDDPGPVRVFHIGFYDESAIKAQANNEGGRSPRRNFFAASGADLQQMERIIGARQDARLKQRR
jgi:hypothetical protein